MLSVCLPDQLFYLSCLNYFKGSAKRANYVLYVEHELLDTVHDCYSLQSCIRMGSTFFLAFFSDFGRNGFVEN